MRVLHTSDWHLGQNFFTKSRKKEHQAFMLWLLEQVDTQSIDAVIVAGDVFDTGAPPSYARELYNQFVVDLQNKGCTLVVLGGNHDSVSTLNESKQLLACLNTYVVASSDDDLSQQLFTLNNSKGEPGAILCAIPYLRPRDLVRSEAGLSSQQKQQGISEAIKQHYGALYQLALEKREQLGINLPIITTGHLTALGVSQSESVRDIYIGTLDGFAADGFPPADYIALGHIHRPQIVAKRENIRYCGSPIPLSFDELSSNKRSSNKQVVLVEFETGGQLNSETQPAAKIELLPIPMFQPMATIKGDLAHIESELTKLCSELIEGDEANREKLIWLAIEVESQDYLTDLQHRIQTLIDGSPVEVLQLRRARQAKSQALQQQQAETLAELTPFDVFEKRLAQEVFESDVEQKRCERITQQFRSIVEEVRHEHTEDKHIMTEGKA